MRAIEFIVEGITQIPAAPGTTPVKPGFVRLYHQTDGDNLRAIEREGLLLQHAKGIEGPRAIYAGEDPFYGTAESRPTLEFQVPQGWWQAPFVLHDVAPDYFIAAHYPWHKKARYLENKPEALQQALQGKFDNLTGDAAKAVEYVKSRHSDKLTEDGQRVYFHGTKTPFDEFDLEHGSISIDRAIGPHFSGTPELASRFALQNPGGLGRGKQSGGHIRPVHLQGEIYTLPQQAREDDSRAVARDVIRVVFPARPDLKKQVFDYVREQIKNIEGTDVDRYMEYFASSSQLIDTVGWFPDVRILKELARSYRELLKSQGYGIIKYTNTGKKERKGLRGEDLDSFIALLPPASIFKQGQP